MTTDAKPKVTPRTPSPPPEDADLLKLEEAGYLLGRISARSVRRLIDVGQMKAVRVTAGGQLRVRREEVARYVRASEFAERPEPQPDPQSSADAAISRQHFKAKIKADWNTGEDLIDDAPGRKGGGRR